MPLLARLVLIPLLATSALPLHGDWKRFDSPHFIVFHDGREQEGQRLAQRLETFHRAIGPLLLDEPLMQRPEVIVFKRRETAQPYLDLLFREEATPASGIFVDDPGGAVVLVDGSAGNTSTRTIYHELVHSLLAERADPLPLWIFEGLAEFFSDFRETRSGLVFGGLIASHRAHLRRGTIPLGDMMIAPTAAAVYRDPARRASFYAQSWAAAHYLVTSRPDGLERISDLAEMLARGDELEAALERTFQLTIAELERIVALYGSSSPPSSRRALRAQNSGMGTGPVRVSPVSELDILDRLAFLVLRVRIEDDAHAERLLREILVRDPLHPSALTTMAVLRTHQGRMTDAERLFDQAVKQAPDNRAIRYRYASALLRRALPPFPQIEPMEGVPLQIASRARELYRGLLADDDDDDDSDHFVRFGYAVAQSVSGSSIEEPLEMFSRLPAGRLRRQGELHHLALLYRSEREAEAEELYVTLAERNDPMQRAGARAILLERRGIEISRSAAAGDFETAARLTRELAAATENDDLQGELEREAERYLLSAEQSIRNRQMELMAEEINQKASRGEYAGAARLTRLLAEDTDDPAHRLELLEQAAEFDALQLINEEIATYNRAVALTNEGKISQALRIVRQILASSGDPQILADARRLESELHRRISRGE
jgi:hypothetical protein